jgi:hypothetical protein
MRIIGLDLVLVLFLGRRTEDLFLIFAPPSFHRILVTPYKYPLLLISHAFMPKVLGKPDSCMFLCQNRAALSTLIADVIDAEVAFDNKV